MRVPQTNVTHKLHRGKFIEESIYESGGQGSESQRRVQYRQDCHHSLGGKAGRAVAAVACKDNHQGESL